MKYTLLGLAYLLGALSLLGLILLIVAKVIWLGIYAVYQATMWLLS